jgi:hypothetical protein
MLRVLLDTRLGSRVHVGPLSALGNASSRMRDPINAILYHTRLK